MRESQRIDAEAETYLRYMSAEKGFSKHTIRAYQRDLDQFFQFLYGRPPTRLVVRQYVAALSRQEYARRTISRKVAALRSSSASCSAEGGSRPTRRRPFAPPARRRLSPTSST